MSIRTDIAVHAGSLEDVTDAELGISLAQATNLSYSALPDSLMQQTTVSPIELHGGNLSVNVVGKTVLSVTRSDDDGNEHICIEANPLKWSDYTDSSSIYYATKHTPSFTIKQVNGAPVLQVAPSPDGPTLSGINTAKVVWRTTHQNLESELDNQFVSNYPTNAHRYLMLATAMIVLGVKLREIILEEEDAELSQLVQQQMSSVNGMMQAEATRLGSEEKSPLNEQSIDQIADPSRGRPTQR